MTPASGAGTNYPNSRNRAAKFVGVPAIDDQVANLPQRSGVIDALDPRRQVGCRGGPEVFARLGGKDRPFDLAESPRGPRRTAWLDILGRTPLCTSASCPTSATLPFCHFRVITPRSARVLVIVRPRPAPKQLRHFAFIPRSQQPTVHIQNMVHGRWFKSFPSNSVGIMSSMLSS